MSATKRLAFGAAVVLGLAGAFWAGRVTMQPAATASDLPGRQVLAEVSQQTVGRQLTLNVTVTQPKRSLAANGLAGVVTAVATTTNVKPGDTLYVVAGVPVRAVQGSMPFYRPLAPGASGTDVRQLEDALVALGLLGSADTKYDEATAKAVSAWQGKLGQPKTGQIALGELVAVPKLPTALLLDDKVLSLGALLSGGEKIVFGATGTPAFALILSDQQARMVPAGAEVTMKFQGKQWKAVVGETTRDENGQIRLALTGPEGGSICGADCGLVSTGSEVSILSQVAVVPPASGPAVPVAAIVTGPDGKATVTVVDAAGVATPKPVKVLGSQDGVAIVEGVTVGEKVQVLSGRPAQPAPGAPASSATPTR